MPHREHTGAANSPDEEHWHSAAAHCPENHKTATPGPVVSPAAGATPTRSRTFDAAAQFVDDDDGVA